MRKLKELIKKIIPEFLINWYHFLLAFLGVIFYGFPSRKLKVIGITGTNGKTTTSEMVTKILEEAGYKVALMNSIRFKIGEKEWQNNLRMTMPGRFKIQRFLRKGVNSGCQYAVLEVTSEGIKQHRHQFIKFEVAVFTNLTPEHIEAHKGFENYRKAKGKLFKKTKNIHVINLDDKNTDYFLKIKAKEKWGYRIKGQNLKFNNIPKNLKLLEINKEEVNLKIPGLFNVYNALAAICVGLSQNISLEKCKSFLKKFEGIAGRMEEVILEPFKVIVDYAFTPNALENVYQTIIENYKLKTENSKLICVLGACGGGRDKWKRPILGKLAAQYCNEVIVTNEDPYDEDPMEIINQVAKGAEDVKINERPFVSVYKILDRRQAIRRALELAKTSDVVIITGKGCEPSICLADGKKIPWSDKQVVEEEFKKLKLELKNETL